MAEALVYNKSLHLAKVPGPSNNKQINVHVQIDIINNTKFKK